MVSMKEILPLTGYIRGGVSPLGMKKEYPTYGEEMIFLHDEIIMSAGQRGLQIRLNPNELHKVIKIEVGDIADGK